MNLRTRSSFDRRPLRFFAEPVAELTRRTAREGSESVQPAQVGKMLVPGLGPHRVVGEFVPVQVELASDENPFLLAAALLERGSIPACAGKPTVANNADVCPRVHPRVCGEARIPPAFDFPI